MMGAPWLHLGSLTVRAPVTAAMNLIMAVQCAAYGASLSGAAGARARHWRGFFFAMSLATLAGVPKHGFRHVMGGAGLFTVLWISNGMGGLATTFAQRASISTHLPGGIARRSLEAITLFQLGAFLLANLAMGPEMSLLIGHMALGLVPVIVGEGRAGWRGAVPARFVAGGLILSLGTGLVYLVRLSPSRWFNHIDVAHTLMAVSFHLLFLGARGLSAGTTLPEHARQEEAPSWT